MAQQEEFIASVTVSSDTRFLPPVVSFVRSAAHELGLKGEVAEHLDRAVEMVCRNVIEYAFESREGKYDIHVLRRPGRVVIAVEDRGIPFDYARLQSSGAMSLKEMLPRSFDDEIRFVNLGRHGNRVELIKRLPHTDIRDHVSEEEHHRVVRAPAASDDVPLQIRMMHPEESVELSRCVYRSYGYSYDWDYIYYPEHIRELQESGLMRSCVAVTPEEEFVGHLAVRVENPDSPVGEAGQAVVDPRFRGHRLFERIKTFLADEARKRGMYGLYSEATAVHPYSQKGNLKLGAKETGFLLGYIPASVSYEQISERGEGRRGSIALFYMRVNAEPEREIYPPAHYSDVIRGMVEHSGLRRTLIEVTPDTGKIPPSSVMSLNVRRDHNTAFLQIAEPGADLQRLLRLRLRELCQHRIDCIYADLPLCHPATAPAGVWLQQLGFFFGGIIPEAHSGPLGGDVLRLQYLNEVEIEAEDISTASDFGKELVEFIFQEKNAVER